MTDKLTVLIVDDKRTNLALMDMLVRKLPNCATLLYADPLEVRAALPALNFDIAVFDYQMRASMALPSPAPSATSRAIPTSRS